METEYTECQDCENGTVYLSNFMSQECEECEGTGQIEID